MALDSKKQTQLKSHLHVEFSPRFCGKTIAYIFINFRSNDSTKGILKAALCEGKMNLHDKRFYSFLSFSSPSPEQYSTTQNYRLISAGKDL